MSDSTSSEPSAQPFDTPELFAHRLFRQNRRPARRSPDLGAGRPLTYRADPDAALRRAPRPVLLGEWQEVPEVLAAVKRVVDVDPTPGQFLLTGSVRAELTNEMWAGTGRVIRLTMQGLTERELAGHLDAAQPACSPA